MSKFFCKSCAGQGHSTNEVSGDRELCVECNIVCPNCNGKGFLNATSDEEPSKGPCEFCYGDGWVPEVWVSKYEIALGPYRKIQDSDEVSRFNYRLHEKFKRLYDKR